MSCSLLDVDNEARKQSHQYDENHNLTRSDPKSSASVAELKKLTSSELRKARRSARDSRSRLFSESSSDETQLKGILKNGRIPTKRSVSECIDDVSQIMADLNLQFEGFPGRFCLRHQNYFAEEDEDEFEEDDDDDNEDDGHHYNREYDDEQVGDDDSNHSSDKNYKNKRNSDIHKQKDKRGRKTKKCDCFKTYSDTIDDDEKPKKSVRFDENVYEAVFLASRLYDRRSLTKYHFSARHHPPVNRNKSSKKKNSKSETSKEDHNHATKSDNSFGFRQTKSQRAKQSKRDKLKRMHKKDDTNTNDLCNSDDQGYSSSIHSFSD